MIWLFVSGWLAAAALITFVVVCAAAVGSRFDDDRQDLCRYCKYFDRMAAARNTQSSFGFDILPESWTYPQGDGQ